MVFAFALTANAQITKNNWMIGGDTYFSSNDYNGDTSNEFRINPNVGYFFIDKLAGGLQMNLAFTNTDPGGRNSKASSYGFAPFARYYFLETDKIINVFTEVNYSFSFGKFGQGDTINWNGYGVKAGTVLFFNSSVGIEFSLNYTNTTRKSDDFKIKTLLVGFGLQIHLEK